jgi:hypothetical protein
MLSKRTKRRKRKKLVKINKFGFFTIFARYFVVNHRHWVIPRDNKQLMQLKSKFSGKKFNYLYNKYCKRKHYQYGYKWYRRELRNLYFIFKRYNLVNRAKLKRYRRTHFSRLWQVLKTLYSKKINSYSSLIQSNSANGKSKLSDYFAPLLRMLSFGKRKHASYNLYCYSLLAYLYSFNNNNSLRTIIHFGKLQKFFKSQLLLTVQYMKQALSDVDTNSAKMFDSLVSQHQFIARSK